MAQLSQWGVPLTVLAMSMLTLLLGVVLNRYQAYQTDVRAVVRRLESGTAALVEARAATATRT